MPDLEKRLQKFQRIMVRLIGNPGSISKIDILDLGTIFWESPLRDTLWIDSKNHYGIQNLLNCDNWIVQKIISMGWGLNMLLVHFAKSWGNKNKHYPFKMCCRLYFSNWLHKSISNHNTNISTRISVKANVLKIKT